MIEIRDGGAFVGDCGLTPQDVDGTIEIEVGYHVRRSLQGRGYATEAAAAARDYARDVLRLDRLVAIIHPANVATQRVAEKIGLALEQELDRHGKRRRIYAGRISENGGPGNADWSDVSYTGPWPMRRLRVVVRRLGVVRSRADCAVGAQSRTARLGG